jgi:hypothetical protein
MGAAAALLAFMSPGTSAAQSTDAPAATAPGPEDPFADPERSARGQAMLERLLASAGGLECWRGSGGYCYQVLATDRVLTDRRTEEWRVNTYVPSLVAFDPDGNGYAYSETVEFLRDGVEYRPQYRRAVREGGACWAEMGTAFFRDPQTIGNVEAELSREFLLACMPFSLSVARATLAFWREQEGEGGKLEVYFMKLHKAQRMEDFEQIRDFVLFVDPTTDRVARLQYILSAKDSDKLEGTTEAYVSFDEWAELELPGGGAGAGAATEPAPGDPPAPVRKLTLPARRYFWHAEPLAEEERATLRQRFGPIPPERLRRPWTSGSVYLMPERADAWDPPVKTPPSPGAAGG